MGSSGSSFSLQSSMFYYGGFDDNQEPHYLDACSLCSKPLYNSDIYMYRGDTPFCSKECRQEQIDLDEAKERKKWKISSSKGTTSRSSVSKSDRESNNSSPNKTVGGGTVAVA